MDPCSHGNMSSRRQKFMDLLQRTGFNCSGSEAHQFDSLIEAGGEFIDWLCDNIGHSNILQSNILIELDSDESGMLIEDVDEALEEAGIAQEDLEVKESDIQLLEEELLVLDSQIKSYDEMIDQSRHECQEMETMVHQLKEDQKVSKELMLVAEQECCMLGNKLDKMYRTIADNLSTLASTFSHIKNNPSEVHLVGQVPLDRYKELVNDFNSVLSKYMLSQFPNFFPQDSIGSDRNSPSIPSFLIGRNNEASAELKDEINRLRISISLAQCGVVLFRSENKSLDSTIKYLEKLNLEDEMEDSERLAREIEKEQAVFNDLIGKTKEACVMTTELEILKHFFLPECDHKMVRQQYWIDKLGVVKDCLQKQLRLGGTLKMMINMESELLAEVNDITNQFQNYLTHEHESFMIRKAAMENVILDFQNSKPVLRKMFEPLVVSDQEDLNTALSRLKEDFDTSAVLLNKEIIQMNEKSVGELEKIVFSGPTKKLLHFGPHLPIYVKVERMLNELEKNMEKLRHDIEVSDNDVNLNIYAKKRKLLWVYFLTDPKKLRDLCGELKSAVDRKLSLNSPVSNPHASHAVDRRLSSSILSPPLDDSMYPPALSASTPK